MGVLQTNVTKKLSIIETKKTVRCFLSLRCHENLNEKEAEEDGGGQIVRRVLLFHRYWHFC